MESLESDTDEERASLLSMHTLKVHYIIQKYIRKKKKEKNNKKNLLMRFIIFLLLART